MSADERWRLLEEAFAKIEPKDEAERERLEQKKERMRVLSESSARELARYFEEANARKADFAETRRLVAERDRVVQETRDALLASLDEQADLIDRIVAARRGSL